MIAAWLARLALPGLAAKLLCILSLIVVTWLSVLWYGHNQHAQGVAQESARRDAIDRQRDKQAKDALAKLNSDVAAKQAALDASQASIAKLGEEISHAQNDSSARQRDYLSGARVMRVAATCPSSPVATQQGQSSEPAGVDQAGIQSTVVLPGLLSANLEWFRQTRDDALKALNACIVSYDAMQEAQK